MAYGFTTLRKIILRVPYKDTQCGFKLFNRQASSKVFSKMRVFNEKKGTQGASVSAGFDLDLHHLRI